MTTKIGNMIMAAAMGGVVFSEFGLLIGGTDGVLVVALIICAIYWSLEKQS